MKIPVIEVKRQALEFNGKNSDLINLIFEDIFGSKIDNFDVKFEIQNNILIKYIDYSYHGSPCWNPTQKIKDPNKIEQYNNLISLYNSFISQERNEQK